MDSTELLIKNIVDSFNIPTVITFERISLSDYSKRKFEQLYTVILTNINSNYQYVNDIGFQRNDNCTLYVLERHEEALDINNIQKNLAIDACRQFAYIIASNLTVGNTYRINNFQINDVQVANFGDDVKSGVQLTFSLNYKNTIVPNCYTLP